MDGDSRTPGHTNQGSLIRELSCRQVMLASTFAIEAYSALTKQINCIATSTATFTWLVVNLFGANPYVKVLFGIIHIVSSYCCRKIC